MEAETIILIASFYHSRDDKGTGKYAFYVLFGLYIALFLGVVVKIGNMIYRRLFSRVIFSYYVWLSWMLLIRIVYFADVFAHYSYLSWFALQRMPNLFWYTAGTILAYGWRNLYLYVKQATQIIDADKRDWRIRKSFTLTWLNNMMYYMLFAIFFILAASPIAFDSQALWFPIYIMETLAFAVMCILALYRGHKLRKLLNASGIVTPVRFKVVNYIYCCSMALRVIANIVNGTGAGHRKQQKENDIFWPTILVIFYILLELLPVFIVLLVVQFRTDEVEEQIEVTVNPSELLLVPGDTSKVSSGFATLTTSDISHNSWHKSYPSEKQ